jgi:hypothetical protein
MKRSHRKRTRVPARIVGAPTVDELNSILGELQQIATSHPALYGRLYQVIGWMLLPDNFIWRQTVNKQTWRHVVVRIGLEEGKSWDAGGGDPGTAEVGAFQGASNDLADHPAAAGPHGMEKAYKAGERKLPREQRRPLTHRRKPKLG